jgi:hypothetical protein
VLVLELGNEERRIADAKSEPVRIAEYRIAGAGPGRIAVEDGGAEGEVIGDGDLQPRARRRFRIIRPAARQIGGGKQRPAEGGIDEQIGIVADHEFLRGGELADPKVELIGELLLDPEIEQPRRGRRLDAGDQHQIVEIDDAELGAMDLMNAGVDGRARPSDELLQVGVDDGAEAAVIAGPLLDAAGRVGEGVAVIAEGELHAVLFEPGTKARGVGDLAQEGRQGKRGRRVLARRVFARYALASAGAGGARNE